MKINLPSGVVLILGLLGGVFAYLNQTTFGFSADWKQFFVFVLAALPVLGVSPLTGTSFRNALHLPPGVASAISVAASVLAIGITTLSLGADVKGILEGVLAFAAFAGFGSIPAGVRAAVVR